MKTATTLILLSAAALAQPPDEIRTRNLWNPAFLESRPAPVSQPGPKPLPKAAAQLGNSFVGFTLWKMRRATGSEPVRVRGFVHPDDPGGRAEWTPERGAIDEPIQPDQDVRISIESARKGFLYVINRDVYADGTTSEPKLIFPTTRLSRGDNRIMPGVPIEIPSATDKPIAFKVERTRQDQVSIDLTVIVAPQPIKELSIGKDQLTLGREQAAAYEKKWGAKVQRLDAKGDKGKLYTAAEHAAAMNPSAALGHDDPTPSTLFHCQPKAGDPMLVKISLGLK